jgi:hypothetical protein
MQQVLQKGQRCLERKLVGRQEQILDGRFAKLVMVCVNG